MQQKLSFSLVSDHCLALSSFKIPDVHVFTNWSRNASVLIFKRLKFSIQPNFRML